MVDPGDRFYTSLQLILHSQLFQKGFGADLDAVAQPHSLYSRIPLHIAGKDPHRVGIIQEPGVRAYLFHIPGKVFQHRNSPKTPHDTADPQTVCNGLAQAIFFGYLKICDGAGIISSHLYGVYHKVSAS